MGKHEKIERIIRKYTNKPSNLAIFCHLVPIPQNKFDISRRRRKCESEIQIGKIISIRTFLSVWRQKNSMLWILTFWISLDNSVWWTHGNMATRSKGRLTNFMLGSDQFGSIDWAHNLHQRLMSTFFWLDDSKWDCYLKLNRDSKDCIVEHSLFPRTTFDEVENILRFSRRKSTLSIDDSVPIEPWFQKT